MKRKKSVPYEDDLIESLRKNPEEAAAYLSAALEDGDPGVFFLALKDCIKAFGGMAGIARKTGLAREALYRSLSETGNPEFKNVNALIGALGFKISIDPLKKKPAKDRKGKAA
ncbi:MAG: putative addiction module antidote protein [Nitrospinae bacterium]|nr:putative addiction module antidote protein [Nitrospinota bacterium]